MHLVNSGMFTPIEMETIKVWAGKIYAKRPSDFMQYGVQTFDQLTRYLKENGRWPHDLFTQYILEVATLDYWISQNKDHILVNEAKARLTVMSSVVASMLSIKLNPEILQSIQLPDLSQKSRGITWFMEQYGKIMDVVLATKKRFGFISQQSDSLTALELTSKAYNDLREAEEKVMIKVLSGQTISIEESQKSTIEAVQKALDAIKQTQK